MTRVLLLLGPVSVIAALTFAAWQVSGVNLGGGTVAHETGTASGGDNIDAVSRTGNLLRTSNRDALKVCVELVGVNEDQDLGLRVVENVTAALNAGRTALDNRASESGILGLSTMADPECPGPPAGLYAPTVDVPSEYLLHVYVIADGQTASYIGNRIHPYASQEFMCEGDVCAEVTAGLYVEEGTAVDAQKLTPYIHYALGLGTTVAEN